ncbi:hypothetical protein ACLIA0_06030 [Bacillaceae bacterium W0354]
MKRIAEGDFTKPFWRTWWFWLLVALIVMRLPFFGGDQSHIPEGVGETFYYSAKECYEDLIDGWIDREAPGDFTIEWINYHYEEIDSPKEQFTDTEKEVIDALNTMLSELLILEKAIEQGGTREQYAFVDAAKIAQQHLNIDHEPK